MSGGQHGGGGGIRKMLIVLLLVGGLILVHRFASRTVGFDPSGMLSLGFVILASYGFGQLVGRIGLPHLTGYILAGIALGPSAAHVIPEAWRLPPFDQGVLSENVMTQLRPFAQLAVGLIALTAGGELRLALLRKGVASILGMIAGHLTVVGPLVFLFMAAVSGFVPSVRLPGLGPLDTGAMLAMSVVVGAVAISTSPAATVAVVAETRAGGPLTGVVLASVVLMDVVIVVLFTLASAVAGSLLGQSGEQDVGLYLLQHIGGSLAAGAVVGGLMILYLRFVRAELLLFFVGAIFTVTFVAGELHLEPVLLFISAGFVAANFSKQGEALLETVERLFLPVSVVFFTLAGARLHLDVLVALAPFALTMVALRAGGTFVGSRAALRIARSPDVVRRLAWVGFVPQAGVSLALAAIVGRSFGETGRTFETLLVAGIAINELVGPVLLKLGISRAGEVGGADRARTEGAPPVEPEPVEAPAAETAPRVRESVAPGGDPWGPRLRTSAPAIDEAVEQLEADLALVVRDVATQPVQRQREEALVFVRDLRRELLRHHRRITVQVLDAAAGAKAIEALRLERSELAEKWRLAVLARASRVASVPAWSATPILEAVEARLEELPEHVEAIVEDASFEPHEADAGLARLARAWLRVRRGARRLFGEPTVTRRVPVRALARYHLWGLLPERLEPVAALHASAEAHLVARTRSIFEALVSEYDELAEELARARAAPRAEGGEESADLERITREIEPRLRGLRESMDEELGLMARDVERLADELIERSRRGLGACVRAIKSDVVNVGTPDLPERRRAASRLFARRQEQLRWLEKGAAAARETAAAMHARLALEMELLGLEGRVKEALDERASNLAKDIRGRGFRQLERVHEALETALESCRLELEGDSHADALAAALRRHVDPLVRVAAEAARTAALLRDQLNDESSSQPIVTALERAAEGLTERYRIPAGPVPRAEHKLPPVVAIVDVPFREWVLTRIETGVAPKLALATRESAQKIEPLAQALSELERRVAFNLELAVSELGVLEDEPVPSETRKLVRDMTVGTLERNADTFGGYAASASAWSEQARASLRAVVHGGLEELRAGLVDGEAGRLRSKMVRDVRGRALLRRLADLRAANRRAWRVATSALREAIGEARLDRWRARVGLPTRALDEELSQAAFAAAEPAGEIPRVYRRLFAAQALEAGDILTGRSAQLGRAHDLLERGGGGKLRTIALVGPDGVGKSAFVHALARSKRWTKVRELKLQAPASVAEVDALFPPDAEGHLVVVNGLHWLRALAPGGFAPLRRFVAGVIADGGKNAFLVRADRRVWKQSCELAPLSQAFPEVVRLDPLGPAELEAAVLARHAVSGYGLVFRQGEGAESRLEEMVVQATAPLRRPQQSFFRALHGASGGLLRDALRLWLASVETVDEA
ncbi:MAG: cation:proton antiporter, partial [Sandaracinaceae bacterium]|nr:cation:proton antiporter [Sandaracinaceae bacterium]